jgi:hypothetical protein
MKETVSIVMFLLWTSLVIAQSKDMSSVDVKLGIGASFLGTGDMLVGKVEAELSKKWNRIISNSISLNLGYGDSKLYDKFNQQKTFITHLDANLFVSPFGNHRLYNFKLGTGLSLMYVSDNYPTRYIWYGPPARRASIGGNMIVEQEITIAKRNLFGLKAMIQPYLNGDIATSVMLKIGRKL